MKDKSSVLQQGGLMEEVLENLRRHDFSTLNWGRRTLLVKECFTSRPFLPEDLWEVLGRSPAVFAEQQVRASSARSGAAENAVKTLRSFHEARDAWRAGFGLSVNRLERVLPSNHPFRDLSLEIQAMACCEPEKIQITAFLTPPHQQNFGRHTDANHVFTLQLEGEKRWVVEDGGVPEEYRLARGDFLYTPEGVPHTVFSEESTSLSAAIIVVPPTFRDLAHLLVTRVLAAAERSKYSGAAPLPLGWGSSPQQREAVCRRIEEALRDICVESISRQTVEAMACARLGTVPLSRGLPYAPVVSVFDSEGTYVLADGCGTLAFFTKRDTLTVAARGRPQLRLPKHQEPALHHLNECCTPFSRGSMAEVPSSDGHLGLFRCLFDAGYIVPAGATTGAGG